MMPRLVIAALAVTFSVSGCTPTTPAAKPNPSPSASPLFASDEEALAAATTAYAAYLKMSDTILQEGGANPERIEAFAAGNALQSAEDGFESFRTNGNRSVGSSTFRNMKIQSVTDEVTAYVCLDVSAVDVLNSQGMSVVSPDRPESQPFELSFEPTGTDNSLQLTERDAWSDQTVCGS